MSEIEKAIHAREDARGKALVEGDYATLAGLMTEDLVHVHANGAVETKFAYIESMKTKLEFLSVSRPHLHIRVYGDVAVSVGPMEQTVRIKGPGTEVQMKAVATQVWRMDEGSWRICSLQATNIA